MPYLSLILVLKVIIHSNGSPINIGTVGYVLQKINVIDLIESLAHIIGNLLDSSWVTPKAFQLNQYLRSQFPAEILAAHRIGADIAGIQKGRDLRLTISHYD